MVPKIFSAGKSFKSLAAYLLHDPQRATTSERIRWTRTLNLAADEPALAVDEMLWTCRSGEALKRQNAIEAGGRRLRNPVKHFSLNWHPSQNPSREHMVATVESFMAHMGWHDHQALVVCHDDKHPHVHVMVNAVHPETGRALDTSFERRRAQEWAARYEREHQLIFCEERLQPPGERSVSPTRETWQALRHYEAANDRAEIERVAAPVEQYESDAIRQDREWRMLKAHQRHQREQFFLSGKQAYRDARNTAFREVRAEFREQWRDYYAATRRGEDCSDLKHEILDAQRRVMDERMKRTGTTLRESRDTEYAALLKRQRDQRTELRDRQESGLQARPLADPVLGSDVRRDEPWRDFTRAKDDVCRRDDGHRPRAGISEDQSFTRRANDHFKVKGAADLAGSVGLGALGALASIGERLFDGFFGGGAKPKRDDPPPPKHETEESFEALPDTANEQVRAAEADALREFWQQRRQRRRERD